MKKGKNGITLIALIITVIVLLILSGISITMVTGNNSILTKVNEAKSQTEIASFQEEAEIVRMGAQINRYSGNEVGENVVLQREGLLNLLNEHFKGSTRRGNRIITKNGEYDIVVRNNLEIAVVKRGQSYLKPGEMDIAYYIPSEVGAKSKRIELLYDLGREEDMENQQTYWDYAFSKVENLSEESLEDLLILIHGLDSKEALYSRLCGKTTKEGAIEKLAEMGMTYREALKLAYVRPIGGITQPVLDYLTEVQGKTFGIEVMYNIMLQEMSEEEKAGLIEMGVTDVDSYIRYAAQQEGRDEEEMRQEMEMWSLFLGVMTEMANKSVIVHNPDGSQEEVMDMLMFSEYVVKENGEYTFTADGPNGEHATITVTVTGIGPVYEDFTNEEIANISEKTIKFVVNTGDDGKITLPISTSERVIVEWGDGETTTNNVKDLGRINKSPDDWLKHEYTQKNTELTVIVKGNVHMINSANSTRLKILEVTDWGESDLSYINLEDCSNLRRIASPKSNSFKNLKDVERIFMGCTNLKTLPENLFNNCTKITSFASSFAGSGIEQIPSSLFEGCTNVTNFEGTFARCRYLTAIPQGIFEDCLNVSSFRGTFYECSSLTGVVPELWTREPIPEGNQCFSQCWNVDNFENIPEDWRYMPTPR